jgi:hypothetical protein
MNSPNFVILFIKGFTTSLAISTNRKDSAEINFIDCQERSGFRRLRNCHELCHGLFTQYESTTYQVSCNFFAYQALLIIVDCHFVEGELSWNDMVLR